MDSTQHFIVQKTAEALRAVEGARVRARQERTLIGLAHIVSRVQVNQLVRPLPSVRAAMLQFHAETQRQAARLATEQVSRYRAGPRTQESSKTLNETIRACSSAFPREAALLRSCASS